ncbi:MAG: CPBP family intramembrane metalloprotease [Deltaproteobacteria bacterium]|nr:CPBP family intramembrane metalloprotease [Deltaproteobacteria bacterium]
MIGPPALPSWPPPPRPERAMSLAGAALWVAGITLGFVWLAAATALLRPAASRDLLSQFVCQLAAYSAGLFLLLRRYAPETSVRAFLGLRRAHAGFYALGAALGVAVALPANWLYEMVQRVFPRPGDQARFVAAFFAASAPERVLIVLAVGLCGPIVEEAVFRGALYRPLLPRNRPLGVVAATAALFALAHLDTHRLGPVLVVGLLLGYLRFASRSLVPPILLHVGFNAVPLVALLVQGPPRANADPPDAPLAQVLVASAACVALVAGVWWLARHVGRRHGSIPPPYA